MRKRIFVLSVLLLTLCGQMWALSGYRSGTAYSDGTTNGISYTLYHDYSYYRWWPDQSQYLGDVAVITSCSNSTMVIPESLGGCNQIVIGESALTSSVTSLTISNSVKLLEYCAVYYADQIETLVIEDSETPLFCGGTKLTYSYGAFSFIENLKSVYIGRNLEYEHTDSDHTYAPFRYCESSDYDVTIGPRVTMIADYCFERCDNINSIKAMPQTPPTCGIDAFYGVTNNIPIYVSYKTIDAYRNYLNHPDWAYFTNYVLDTDLCKADALNDLDAEAGQNPSEAVLAIVNNYKNQINAATSADEVVAKLNAGRAAIQLQKEKEYAIAELIAAATDYPSDEADGIVSTYTERINVATTTDAVTAAKEEGIQKLMEAHNLPYVKADAIADLNEAAIDYPSDEAASIVTTYTDRINAATTTDAVTAAKNEGIQALQNAYNNEQQIALQNAKADAIAELEAAATTYPSDAAAGLVTTYTDRINAATTIDAVTAAKNEGIQALQNAYNEQIALQNAKADAIAELNEAAIDYPSDAADEIVSNYTATIYAATTIDAVTAAKEEGIQALLDAYVQSKINAVVVRQSNAAQEMLRIANTPNIILTEDVITFKNGDQTVKEYNFSDGTITLLFALAINGTESIGNLTHPVVIENGGKLTVSGTMSNENAQDLVIENGGQLRFDAGTANAIVKKTITGYNNGNGNWYLVASPVAEATPTAVGMIDQTTPENYDLYAFDQTGDDEGKEWLNNKVQGQEIESLEIQNGYLYARKNGTTLTFNGNLIASASAKDLVYDQNAEFAGFNLVGNPYTCDAYIGRNFYRMNDEEGKEGTELILSSGAIHALEGVFVQALDEGESVTFSKDAPTTQNGMCAMTLSQGTANIDRAIVNFGKGGNLDKFMLDPTHTNIRLDKDGEEYAAVSTSSTSGEIPVNFKAAKNGSYTITVSTENVEAEYMHLIDNMTGMDIDLLATPSYSFHAKTSDYASRFKLVFGVKDTEPAEVTDTFAFISNGEIIISNEGRATLQVVDVLGRIVSSEEINGEAHISTNGLTAGVYVLNLNGMTQKIVVK